MTRYAAFAAVLLFGAVLLLAAGCEQAPAGSSYVQEVLQHRVSRDMSMREKNSVLPRSARAQFKGLRYYDVDTTYRYTLPLREATSPDTLVMAGSAGQVVPQVQVGWVEVPFPSGPASLAVYYSLDTDEEQLWIPFTDPTNGGETYEAGRYLDAEPASEDRLVIDFNYAYNPTCVYNPEYNCPLPPEENGLGNPVPAGEKVPLLGTR